MAELWRLDAENACLVRELAEEKAKWADVRLELSKVFIEITEAVNHPHALLDRKSAVDAIDAVVEGRDAALAALGEITTCVEGMTEDDAWVALPDWARKRLSEIRDLTHSGPSIDRAGAAMELAKWMESHLKLTDPSELIARVNAYSSACATEAAGHAAKAKEPQ